MILYVMGAVPTVLEISQLFSDLIHEITACSDFRDLFDQIHRLPILYLPPPPWLLGAVIIMNSWRP